MTPLEPELEPEFPNSVTIAGIIWIVNGAIVLLTMLALVAAVLIQATGPREVDVFGEVANLLFFLLVGGVFIHVGVDSVRGKAKDTLGNGIGSLAFAVIAVLGLISAIGLLTAGVLALVGRAEYRAWRNYHQSPATTPNRVRKP